jgi:preprotein translocase subunit SecE
MVLLRSSMPVLDFLKEVRVELSKVVWPSRSQTIQLTLIVIIVTVIVGFFVAGVDYILANLLKLLTRA